MPVLPPPSSNFHDGVQVHQDGPYHFGASLFGFFLRSSRKLRRLRGWHFMFRETPWLRFFPFAPFATTQLWSGSNAFSHSLTTRSHQPCRTATTLPIPTTS